MEYGFRLKSDPSQDDRCKKDELYFENACYYISKDEDELVSQEVAGNEWCSSRNATLVSIRNAFENAFVAKETSPLQGSLYWTGLFYNDTSAHEAFMWLDDSPLSFTKWGKYEPASPMGENQGCVLLMSDGHEFVWSVSNCSVKAQYVCKSNLTEAKGPGRIIYQSSLGFLNESDKLALPETLPPGCEYFNQLWQDFLSDSFV